MSKRARRAKRAKRKLGFRPSWRPNDSSKGSSAKRTAGFAAKSFPAAASDTGQPSIDHRPEGSDLALARACVELWRLGRRVQAMGDERLVEGIRKAFEELELAGCRVDDPVGMRYVDGLVMEIVGDVPSASSAAFVTDTIRPAVFVNGRLVLAAQVFIGPECGRE